MSGAPHKFTLRELTTLEGQCNGDVVQFLRELGVPVEDMTPRQRAAYDVIRLYRPARAKLRSTDPAVQEEGREEMQQFAATRFRLSDWAREEGDFLGSMHILQTRASALGVMGNQPLQRQALQSIWTDLERFFTADSTDDDAVFVRAAVFAGLIENDPDFAQTVNLQEYRAFVVGLETRRDPNFPGRVLVLCRRLIAEGHQEVAIDLLNRAAQAPFGKEDQRRDVYIYLNQLTTL